jgi:uncharacterized protein YkwD
LAAVLTPLLVPARAEADPGDVAEHEIVNVINAYRTGSGLRPLRVSRSLNGSAKRYSNRLMARDYFGHAARVQASGRFRSLGEVLQKLRGRRYRVRLAVRRWMRSGGHRFVLMHPSMRWVGAGVTRGRFRGRSATIWVVQLGR